MVAPAAPGSEVRIQYIAVGSSAPVAAEEQRRGIRCIVVGVDPRGNQWLGAGAADYQTARADQQNQWVVEQDQSAVERIRSAGAVELMVVDPVGIASRGVVAVAA